jgi:polar amino acid transport system substrate-binding protein
MARPFMLLALAVAVVGCAPVDETASSAAATPSASTACAKEQLTLVTPGKLTIGTDKPAYEPWFQGDDPTNGEGFESAVAYAVAERLGFGRDEVTWVTARFNNVIAPGPKTFDVAINQVSITEERREAVDFSSGYYDVTQAVIALGDNEIADATSIAELKGAKLGAAIGTTSYDVIVDRIKPEQEAAPLDDNDIAKQSLKNGQIDGLVLDLPTAFFVTSAEIDGAKIVGQFANAGGEVEQFGLVLEKDSPLTACVSGAVDALRADGTLKRIEEQYLTANVGAPVLS